MINTRNAVKTSENPRMALGTDPIKSELKIPPHLED